MVRAPELDENVAKGGLLRCAAPSWLRDAVLSGRAYGVDAGVLFIGLVMLWAGVVGVSATADVPYGDEYDYARIAGRLSEVGQFERPPETAAMFVTAAYWGALFVSVLGQGLSSVRLSVLAAAWLAMTAVSWYLAWQGVSRAWRLLLVGVAFVNPLTVPLLFAFTTDMIFAAQLSVSLVLYLVGTERASARWLVAGSAAGAVALGNREIGVLVLPGVLIALWLRHAPGRLYVAAAAPLLLAFLTYGVITLASPRSHGVDHVWWPLHNALAQGPDRLGRLAQFSTQTAYIGIVLVESAALGLAGLIPLAVSRLGRHRPLRAETCRWPRSLGLGIPAVLLSIDIARIAGRGPAWTPVENVLGLSATLAEPGHVGSTLALFLADASLAIIAVTAGLATWRRREAWRLLACSIPFVLILAMSSLVGSVYPRYAIPLLVPCILAGLPILGGGRHRALAWGVVTWSVLLLVALLSMRVEAVSKQSIWDTALRLEVQGVAAADIDAGFEWRGVHGQLGERASHAASTVSWDDLVARVEAPYAVTVDRIPTGYVEREATTIAVLPWLDRRLSVSTRATDR